MKLTDTPGKSISDFCQNDFIHSADNHCAHFVCHFLQLDIGYTCRVHRNGRKPGACLRVQELFAACPEVGPWGSQPAGSCLVFVTDQTNVDLAGHAMRNVPKKHVGIYSEGLIYNYSNTADKVVSDKPDAFLQRFSKTYGGNQALYFGTFPPGAAALAAPAPMLAQPATSPVVVAAATGQPPVIREQPDAAGHLDYYARVAGSAEFYLARRTRYKSFIGLMQPAGKLHGKQYVPGAFSDAYGPVAGILAVIGAGESSGYFDRLNTYDRAAFTFGFIQLAAHTPRDNLILLIRRLTSEHPPFQALFPDLQVLDGKLHRVVGSSKVSLETEYPRSGNPKEMNLRDFMSYLNPDGRQVDASELSAAARLVYLADSDDSFNALQVNVAAEVLMRRMRNSYALRYDLDGVSDLICAAIADIHHQGRGSRVEVQGALASSSTLDGRLAALCRIGAANYAQRCSTLQSALAKAKADGYLGKHVFDKASGLFRPKAGWQA
jgi:hypothetical protein